VPEAPKATIAPALGSVGTTSTPARKYQWFVTVENGAVEVAAVWSPDAER
jgi:hypothetical protein